MSVSSVTSSTTAKNQAGTAAASPTERANSYQVDFLKLLVAKMQNQNPLDCQNQEEFLSQLASFENLNQTVKLNKNVESMALSQGLSESSSLIGKWVELDNSDGGTVTGGKVSAVKVVDGICQVVVEGALFSLDKIQGVTNDITG